jgi:hyperosmotically inducible protein
MNEPSKDLTMKNLHNFKLIGISMLLAFGVAACNKAPGPAESAGKQIDQAANDASKKVTETIDKVGEKLNDQSVKTGVVVDDVEITTRVKAAIFAEAGLKTLQISVDTVKGVVTLSGSVNTMANSETAKSLAGAVVGVKEVKNNLVIKPN